MTEILYSDPTTQERYRISADQEFFKRTHTPDVVTPMIVPPTPPIVPIAEPVVEDDDDATLSADELAANEAARTAALAGHLIDVDVDVDVDVEPEPEPDVEPVVEPDVEAEGQSKFNSFWEEIEARETAKDMAIAPEFGPNKIVLDYRRPAQWAEKFLEVHPTLAFYQDDFAEWNGSAYRVLERVEIESMIARMFKRSDMRNKFGNVPAQTDPAMHATDRDMGEMISALKQNRLIPNEQTIPFLRPQIRRASPENFPDPNECVAFSNCILHVPSGEVLELTPFFYTYNSRPFAYVADAKCPTWDRVVQDWFPDVDGKPAPEARLLQEVAGYLLTPWTSMQKFFILQGNGRTGKGIIVDILTHLLGELNTVTMSMAEIGSAEHSKAGLINKLAAFVTEVGFGTLDEQGVATEYIKKVVGCDRVSIKRPNNKKPWYGKLGARFLLTPNPIPTFKDNSPALRERIVALKFSRAFSDDDKDIDMSKKLLPELAGIFCWARAGYLRLKANGKFTVPASSIPLTRAIVRAASGVEDFMADECTLEPGAECTEAALYVAFTEWCAANGTRPMAKGACVRAVLVARAEITSYRPRVEGQSRERRLCGIRINDHAAGGAE